MSSILKAILSHKLVWTAHCYQRVSFFCFDWWGLIEFALTIERKIFTLYNSRCLVWVIKTNRILWQLRDLLLYYTQALWRTSVNKTNRLIKPKVPGLNVVLLSRGYCTFIHYASTLYLGLWEITCLQYNNNYVFTNFGKFLWSECRIEWGLGVRDVWGMNCLVEFVETYWNGFLKGPTF